jgi:hypothetical protein
MDDTVCMSIKYGKLVLHRYINIEWLHGYQDTLSEWW